MDYLHFRHSMIMQSVEGQQKAPEVGHFAELKHRLLQQLEVTPDLLPLKSQIDSLIKNVSHCVAQIESLPKTINIHGHQEFKAHIQSVLQSNLGDFHQLNDFIDCEKLRETIKKRIVEVTDEIQRVYGPKSKICPHYATEFLQVIFLIQILNEILHTYQYLRVNESQLTHRTALSTKAFGDEKFTQDVKELRQDYFKEIFFCPKEFKNYLKDNTYNSYMTQKQQIQDKIRKLHALLYDKLEGVCNNINLQRYLTQLINRDSQKYSFNCRYLVHFHKESSKITKTLKLDDSQKEKFKKLCSQYSQFLKQENHLYFKQINKQTFDQINLCQDNAYGYKSLLQMDQNLDKQGKAFENLSQIKKDLTYLQDTLKMELKQQIQEFNEQYQISFNDPEKMDFEYKISELFQQLTENLGKEYSEIPVQDPMHDKLSLHKDNEFIQEAKKSKFAYDYQSNINNVLYSTKHLEQKTSYSRPEYTAFVKQRENERAQNEDQRMRDREAALQEIRKTRLDTVDKHLDHLRKQRNEVSEQVQSQAAKGQTVVQHELSEQQAKLFSDQQKQLEKQQEMFQKNQQQSQNKLQEQREKLESEKQRQQEMQEKRIQDQVNKRMEQEKLQKEKEEKQREIDERRKKEKNINDYQQEQARHFEKKINELMVLKVKEERLKREEDARLKKIEDDKKKATLMKQAEDEKNKAMLEKKKVMEAEAKKKQDEMLKIQEEEKKRVELEKKKKQDELEYKKKQQSLNTYQKDQADLFTKKLNDYITFRKKSALSSVNEYQNKQAEIFEQKIKLLEEQKLLKSKQGLEHDKYINEQALIFEKKLNEYILLLQKTNKTNKDSMNTYQIQQADIFEIKYKNLLLTYKDQKSKTKESNQIFQNQQAQLFEQKLFDYQRHITAINQRKQQEINYQKEQSVIFERKLAQYSKYHVENQQKIIYQKQQAEIFDQKLQQISGFRNQTRNNELAQQNNQKKNYQDQQHAMIRYQQEQSVIFEQKLNQVELHRHNQKKRYIEEMGDYQQEQGYIFEDKLAQLAQYRAQGNRSLVSNKDSTPMKRPQRVDSDSELEFPQEEIEFSSDHSELSPQQKKLQDSEDYLKASKQLYQGEDEEQEEMGGDGETPMPLMGREDLLLINTLVDNYFKEQLTPNLEHCESLEAIFITFDEFINTGKAFFFPIELGQEFLQILDAYSKEMPQIGEDQAFEKIFTELQELFQQLEAFYQEQTQQPQFSPGSRFFIPLGENPLDIFMVEINPLIQSIVTYHTGPCKEPAYIKGVMDLCNEIFSLQEFQHRAMFIQSPEHLKTQTPYVQYLLVLFCVVYELDMETFYQDPRALTIDKNLENRLNITVSNTQEIQSYIQENQEQYFEFFDQIVQESDAEQKHVIRFKSINADEEKLEELQQEIAQEVEILMEHTTHLDSGFLVIEIMFGEDKFTYYLSTEKFNEDKYLLALYMLEGYSEDLNTVVGQTVCSLDNPEFKIQVFMDFARQNQIYELGKICLGLWIGLVDRNDIDAHTAFKLISYNYLPNLMLLS